ncbi:MAG: pilus assembly protein PilW [Ramlibacter sp.]|nr:pilus assembly protein PilW [Ramlibacter sp.]
MYSTRPSSSRRRSLGFTLIELMVGVVIGLLATLAVTQVMVSSEGQKRTTTSGSDAQVNGALALSSLQRSFQQAGYGFTTVPSLMGCTLTAVFNGTSIATLLPTFPTRLAPVFITQGASGAPDSIRVLASGKTSYSVPIRMSAPGYNPTDPLTKYKFSVSSVRSVLGPKTDISGNVIGPGDLMVAASSGSAACEMFQVTSDPGSSPVVDRADDATKWNKVGFPAASYGDGNYLINMGPMVDQTYSVAAGETGGLQVRTLKLAADSTPSYEGPVELFPGIVNLKALYGKGAAGVVTSWDNTTPANAAEWQTLYAVRLVLVARSSQYEKETVTFANPLWDVGNVIPVTGAATCGTSKCVSVKVDHLADWNHYRYKVFDTVIALRNMVWSE